MADRKRIWRLASAVALAVTAPLALISAPAGAATVTAGQFPAPAQLTVPRGPVFAGQAALFDAAASRADPAAARQSAVPRSPESTPATIAFSDARALFSESFLSSELRADRKSDCAGKPLSGARSLAQALADARAIEGKAGRAAVAAVNSSRDVRPADSELDASAAEMRDNPVGALAALLASYNKNGKNPTIVRDIGSVMAQLGEPGDAIALFNQADHLRGQLQHPMGISESATELNDRGFALLELRHWGAAAGDLTRAAEQAPLLAEAKLNLAVALMCQSNIPQAAAALAAGARRNQFRRFDVISGVQLVPASQIIDISYGKAGSWPGYVYPETLGDVLKDGKSFLQFYADESKAFFGENNQAAPLFARGYSALTGASLARMFNLVTAADDSVAGGWAALQARASAAQQKATDFWASVFTGSPGGTAHYEAEAISNAGGDICTVQQPKMDTWLNQQTQIFHADAVAWNDALKAEWSARWKWISGVLANLANPDFNKAWNLYYDADKHLDLEGITQITGYWEQGTQQYAADFTTSECVDTLGPDKKPPPDPRRAFADCPPDLKRAAFKASFEILEISVDCEKISVTSSEPWLGAFVKVSWARTGDVTLVVGAKAGVSLGPAAGKVEAGVYVTVHNGEFTDAGVTASAKAAVTAGVISLTAPSLSGTVSFTNLSSALTSLVQ